MIITNHCLEVMTRRLSGGSKKKNGGGDAGAVNVEDCDRRDISLDFVYLYGPSIEGIMKISSLFCHSMRRIMYRTLKISLVPPLIGMVVLVRRK